MPITFLPLWKTMKQKGVTSYTLKKKLKIGGGTYNRLKTNQSVSTHTVEILCDFLNCEVQDILQYIKTDVDCKEGEDCEIT